MNLNVCKLARELKNKCGRYTKKNIDSWYKKAITTVKENDFGLTQTEIGQAINLAKGSEKDLLIAIRLSEVSI